MNDIGHYVTQSVVFILVIKYLDVIIAHVSHNIRYMFQLAYDAGVPVKASFLFIACLFTLVIASTFWFMPRRHIPFPPPKNYRLTFGCRKTPPPPLQEEVGREDTTDKKDSSRSPVDEQSFKTIAASSLYLLDILWLTCHRFQSWSFVGRLNAILNRLANNDKDIGKNNVITT